MIVCGVLQLAYPYNFVRQSNGVSNKDVSYVKCISTRVKTLPMLKDVGMYI